MGLFDTLKKAAQTANQIANTVQNLEHAADSAQRMTGAKPAAQTDKSAAPAPAAQTKTVGSVPFPQNSSIPGSRELVLEGYTEHFRVQAAPGFLPWEAEAEFALAYLPDCKDDHAPEVLGGAPYLALCADPQVTGDYAAFRKDGTVRFDSIAATGNPQMPHLTMSRDKASGYITRA